MKKWIHFSIGLAISVLCLTFLFWGVDFKQVFVIIQGIEYWPICFAIVVGTISFLIRAVRWQFLIGPIKKISVMNLFSATSIGFMANNILPFRVGEFIRPYIIARKENISFSSSLATIVAERIFDMFTLLIVLFLSFYYLSDRLAAKFPDEFPLMKGAAVALLLAAIAVLFLIILIMERKEFIASLLGRLLRPVSAKLADKITGLVYSFSSGFDVFRDGKTLCITFFYSLLMWFLVTLIFYFTLDAFNLNEQLPFYTSFVIIALIAVAVAPPSAPGFIGIFHLACKMGLMIFDVREDEAVSYAIIAHLINVVPVTLLGLFFLWREKMTLGELSKAKE